MRPLVRNEKRHIALGEHCNEISHCVKCGSCSGVCPTYLHERSESYSPRGRMALINAVLNGRLTVSGIYKDRLATCMTCMACEAVCPSNVPVTEIIQAAKEQVVAESGRGIIGSFFAGMVKRPALFRIAALFAPVALHYSKRPGSMVNEKRLRFADCGLRNGEKRAPKAKGKVAFFPGCAVDFFHQDIGEATTHVLNAIGYDVIVPDDLMCCGRPLLSLGDRKAAEGVAAHNAKLFEALRVDAIVTACASCGLTFKNEYPKLLRPGAKTPVVHDIHEFLSGRKSGLDLKPVSMNVTVHDPCHLGRGQGLSQTVRDLLRAIPALTIVEMKDADRCCGFGGAMRMTHRGISDEIADEKIANIIATGASTVVTGCPGCCMQIADALNRHGSEIRVVHPVQLLEEALLSEE